MAYSVTLYYNTGFDNQNIPYSSAVLANAETAEFEEIPLMQNMDIMSIRITSGWEQVKNADYCKIGDCFYFVTNVTMTAENVAQLYLQMDYVTSIGIPNMTFIDGWVKRRIVTNSEQSLDRYSDNVIPEPWIPSKNLELDEQPALFPKNALADSTYNFILSRVDLLSTDKLADYYGNTDGGVYVPKTINIHQEESTVFELQLESDNPQFRFPQGKVYNADDTDVIEGYNGVNSLGINENIVSSYTVPKIWVDETRLFSIDGDKSYLFLSGKKLDVQSILNYEYYSNIENKKVFALYNDYILFCLANGSNCNYNFGDLYVDGETSPTFVGFADLLPNGGVYCKPKVYKDGTSDFAGAIKSSCWLSHQLVMVTTTGQSVAQANYNYEIQRINNQNETANAVNETNRVLSYGQQINNFAANAIGGNAAGVYKSFVDAPYIDASFDTQYYLNQRSREQATLDANRQLMQNLTQFASPIIFPYTANIASYTNNNFGVLRYKLSYSDANRLDSFLHRYGEAVDEPFNVSYLRNKQSYNYIQTERIQIKSNAGLRYNVSAENVFNAGVRIWHVLPNVQALNVGGNSDR